MTKNKTVVVDTNESEWQPVELPNLPPGAFMKLLNLSEKTGSLTALVKFPAGFVEPRHSHTFGHTVYVIENELGSGNSAYTEGTYWYAPANDVHGPVEQRNDCIFLMTTDGPLDFNLK